MLRIFQLKYSSYCSYVRSSRQLNVTFCFDILGGICDTSIIQASSNKLANFVMFSDCSADRSRGTPFAIYKFGR